MNYYIMNYYIMNYYIMNYYIMNYYMMNYYIMNNSRRKPNISSRLVRLTCHRVNENKSTVETLIDVKASF